MYTISNISIHNQIQLQDVFSLVQITTNARQHVQISCLTLLSRILYVQSKLSAVRPRTVRHAPFRSTVWTPSSCCPNCSALCFASACEFCCFWGISQKVGKFTNLVQCYHLQFGPTISEGSYGLSKLLRQFRGKNLLVVPPSCSHL